jgi:ADP-ribose pyrophosphatase YjhB (NUDIX family)
MQWKPNVTVAAVAQRQGKFLLVEEHENARVVINQPAGHLEKDETLIDAVIREVLEETAWEYRPEAVVGVYLYHAPAAAITYLRVCFAGTCIKHDPHRQLDTGVIRCVWMDRAELGANREHMRSPMVIQCVDDYLAGKRYPLDILNHYL